eukprot:1021135-Prorocentrum_minimum.AAC.3
MVSGLLCGCLPRGRPTCQFLLAPGCPAGEFTGGGGGVNVSGAGGFTEGGGKITEGGGSFAGGGVNRMDRRYCSGEVTVGAVNSLWKCVD